LILPVVFAATLDATTVKKVYPEENFHGDELPSNFTGNHDGKVPSPSKLLQTGTVIDSTMMDHQCNATIHSRIAAVGDSALHITGMVSPDQTFTERGMIYVYYINGVFTNFGYVEGSGVGDQRAGYGSIISYYRVSRSACTGTASRTLSRVSEPSLPTKDITATE
jgi:hypothetical protein